MAQTDPWRTKTKPKAITYKHKLHQDYVQYRVKQCKNECLMYAAMYYQANPFALRCPKERRKQSQLLKSGRFYGDQEHSASKKQDGTLLESALKADLLKAWKIVKNPKEAR